MSWRRQTTPLDGTLAAPGSAYGIAKDPSSGIIVAVGYNPDQPGVVLAMRSLDDGKTWGAVTTPFDDPVSDPLLDVCWSPALGLFLAVGDNGSISPTRVVMTSPDGSSGSWTAHASPLDGNFYATCCCWADSLGLFVVGCGNTSGAPNTSIMTSPDGSTWTAHASPANDCVMNSIAWSQPLGLLLAGFTRFTAGAPLISSSDGSTWSTVSTVLDGTGSAECNRVSWLDQAAVFIATGNADFNEKLISSPDGASFSLVATQAFTSIHGNPILEMADGQILGGNVGTPNGYFPLAVSPASNFTFPKSAFAPLSEVFSMVLSNDADVGVVLAGQTWSFGPNFKGAIVTGSPPGPVPVGTANSPLWRCFVADLSGTGITDFSKLASERFVEPVLNAPLQAGGTVPSDNPQVWLPYTDDGYDDPYLAEGSRLVWWFRRESLTPSYYEVRAGTICNLLEDSADQDDARTRFLGWDPWHYLFSRPVCNADGTLPGPDGISFSDTQVSVIIGTLLRNTILNHGHTYVDAGENYGGTALWEGVLEESAGMEIDINFQQGVSVGQAWQQITDMNVCDIILSPIYDPFNRPNYLVELNVYAQAGVTRDEQIFAWNMPGRSLVGIDRQQDGSQRANAIKFFAGQGGSAKGGQAIPVQEDLDSQAKFGVYYAQQFFPGQINVVAVESLAQQQLRLRANGRETITVRPAPERSPRPWQDYQLGDRCPVWASAQKFRQSLGEVTAGTMTETQYQRIYGWRANISDDALETIDPLLTSPEGF